MGFMDFLRRIFAVNTYNQEFGYLDAEPNLQPDSDDTGGYSKSQFMPKQYSYLRFEIGSDFDASYHPEESIRIDYDGLLKNCGADAVYLHYAFDNWDYHTIRTERMNRDEDGRFTLTIPTRGHREINYCFKDSADHWDNNNGWNWSVKFNQKH